jgi:hypothetical protein
MYFNQLPEVSHGPLAYLRVVMLARSQLQRVVRSVECQREPVSVMT